MNFIIIICVIAAVLHFGGLAWLRRVNAKLNNRVVEDDDWGKEIEGDVAELKHRLSRLSIEVDELRRKVASGPPQP